jgi:predicted Zn finger-like uncharacterized protein
MGAANWQQKPQGRLGRLMYTRCPDCETTFRLGAEDLRRAHGKVRCGDCDNVFNALEFLAEDADHADDSLPVLTSGASVISSADNPHRNDAFFEPANETEPPEPTEDSARQSYELEIKAYDEKTGEAWSPLETSTWDSKQIPDVTLTDDGSGWDLTAQAEQPAWQTDNAETSATEGLATSAVTEDIYAVEAEEPAAVTDTTAEADDAAEDGLPGFYSDDSPFAAEAHAAARESDSNVPAWQADDYDEAANTETSQADTEPTYGIDAPSEDSATEDNEPFITSNADDAAEDELPGFYSDDSPFAAEAHAAAREPDYDEATNTETSQADTEPTYGIDAPSDDSAAEDATEDNEPFITSSADDAEEEEEEAAVAEFDDTVWERIPGVGAAEEQRGTQPNVTSLLEQDDEQLADGLSYTGTDFLAIDPSVVAEPNNDDLHASTHPLLGEHSNNELSTADTTAEVAESPAQSNDLDFNVPENKWSSFFGEEPAPTASLPATEAAQEEELDAEAADTESFDESSDALTTEQEQAEKWPDIPADEDEGEGSIAVEADDDGFDEDLTEAEQKLDGTLVGPVTIDFDEPSAPITSEDDEDEDPQSAADLVAEMEAVFGGSTDSLNTVDENIVDDKDADIEAETDQYSAEEAADVSATDEQLDAADGEENCADIEAEADQYSAEEAADVSATDEQLDAASGEEDYADIEAETDQYSAEEAADASATDEQLDAAGGEEEDSEADDLNWSEMETIEEVVLSTGEFGVSEIASSLAELRNGSESTDDVAPTSDTSWRPKHWQPESEDQAANQTGAMPALKSVYTSAKTSRYSKLWLGVIVLLIIGFTTQLLHYNRDKLAAHPAYGETTRNFYALLGSELHPNWSMSSYEIRGSEAIAGESGQDILDIRTQIASVSPTMVGLPQLRVVLRDRWSNPVAARTFTPEEYADASALPADGMLQSDQSIAAHVAIVDPGSGTQGYQLELCLPRRDTGLECTGQPFK